MELQVPWPNPTANRNLLHHEPNIGPCTHPALGATAQRPLFTEDWVQQAAATWGGHSGTPPVAFAGTGAGTAPPEGAGAGAAASGIPAMPATSPAAGGAGVGVGAGVGAAATGVGEGAAATGVGVVVAAAGDGVAGAVALGVRVAGAGPAPAQLQGPCRRKNKQRGTWRLQQIARWVNTQPSSYMFGTCSH